MAAAATTTATQLNGGTNGGLHGGSSTTQSSVPSDILRSEDVAPHHDPEDTCPMESNSSFESSGAGHEDPALGPSATLPLWATGTDKSAASSFVLSMDSSAFPRGSSSGYEGTSHTDLGGKKRRKQSRPVRIPALESDQGEKEDNTFGQRQVAAQQDQVHRPLRHHLQQHQHHHQQHRSKRHVPLNLCKAQTMNRGEGEGEVDEQDVGDEEHDDDEDEDEDVEDGDDEEDPEEGDVRHKSAGQHRRHKDTEFMEHNKTELTGQGTIIDSLQRTITSCSSPSQSPSSFSPGLFPLNSCSSPFSSLFASGFFSQHAATNLTQASKDRDAISHSLMQAVVVGTPTRPTSGTPTSSSSTGSSNNNNTSSVNNNIASALGGTGSMQNVPPHRIFNPEAYCDLCNKEFCNKYFLKTHKANKHGVYSETPPVIPSLTNMTQVLAQSLSAAAAAASSPSRIPTTIFSSSLQQSSHPGPKQSSTGEHSPFGLTFSDGSKQRSSNGQVVQGRESFCELCQKEFCNKYFLKRHKSKIHGVPMDNSNSSSSSAGGGSRTVDAGLGSKSMSSSSSQRTAFTNGLQLSDDKRTGADGPIPSLPSLRDIGLETLGLELMGKHLMADDSDGEEGEMDQSDDSDSGELLLQANSAAAAAAAINNPDEPQFKLSSRLGSAATPSENLCQFCFREFSNKGQLKSHLLKKHRLLLPTTFPPFLLPFQGLPNLFDVDPQHQHHHHPTLDGSQVPLGVSVGENLTGKNDDGGVTDSDYECNICNRTFQTVYLLRMHKSYFHSEDSETLGESGGVRGGCKSDDDNNTIPSFGKLETKSLEENCESMAKSLPVTAMDHVDNNNVSKTNVLSSPVLLTAANTSGDTPAAVAALSEAMELESRGEGTSDSDDLRRLQTMILELNRASAGANAGNTSWSPPGLDLAGRSSTSPTQTSSSAATVCNLCSKEFYSNFFLQQHIAHFHQHAVSGSSSGSLDNQGHVKSESPSDMACNSSSTNNNGNSKTTRVAPLNDAATATALKERLLQDNLDSSPLTFVIPGPKGANSSLDRSCSSTTVNNHENNNLPSVTVNTEPGSRTAANGNVKRPSPSLSRSYCTICHKELCNKYFMRTHMLKMHGISIESSTGLGGVTCDICNKELCSKYFLKVHKQNTHGIVEDGPSPPNPSTPGPVTSTSGSFPLITSATGMVLNLSTGQNNASSSAESLSEETCPICGRRFRSMKWLKTHLMSDHGQEGRDKWKAIEKTLHPSSRRGGTASKGGSSKSKQGKDSNNTSSGKPLVPNRADVDKCALCGFVTADMETMRVHLLKEHGSQLTSSQDPGSVPSPYSDGQRNMVLDPLTMLFQKMEGGSSKMYRCAYCPFTTSLLVYLYAHERTHTGLANSVLSPSSEVSRLGSGENQGCTSSGATFQCPMCFHTFQQAEAFQQHLIGHQMSGVLAPFFTPGATPNVPGTSGRLAFLTSPLQAEATTCDQNATTTALLSLPMLNGTAGDTLHPWSIKNPPVVSSSSGPQAHNPSGKGQKDSSRKKLGRLQPQSDTRSSPERLTTSYHNILLDNGMKQKRRKTVHFRCSRCETVFNTKENCSRHIQRCHQRRNDRRSREKSSFRCRKCKFTSRTYQMLVVHVKLHHNGVAPRSQKDKAVQLHPRDSLPEGQGVPAEGVQEGSFLMQGFLLTSSEEESSNQSSGYFVPSVVYLPVREKVSQSIRVSFSLTPTS